MERKTGGRERKQMRANSFFHFIPFPISNYGNNFLGTYEQQLHGIFSLAEILSLFLTRTSLALSISSYGWNVFAMCRWMLSHIVCVFYSRSKGIFERCLLAADCVLVRLRRLRSWNKGEGRKEVKKRKFFSKV